MNLNNRIILYVEDDIDDTEILGEAMAEVAPFLRIDIARDGLRAMELLNEQKKKGELPGLIILDLNMPFLDGRKTYECLKSDPYLREIPVAVLSSGRNPADIALFNREGIPYFIKPSEFKALQNIASQMAELCYH